jgi:hypothetical protein
MDPNWTHQSSTGNSEICLAEIALHVMACSLNNYDLCIAFRTGSKVSSKGLLHDVKAVDSVMPGFSDLVTTGTDSGAAVMTPALFRSIYLAF